MSHFFHTAFYQPILNALVGLYGILPVRDLGIAIILLTVVVRAIFAPLSRHAMRSQMALRDIQPKIKELQKQYQKDPQRASKEIMALYRAHRINPFSGFLPMLVQMPVLFALYHVLLAMFRQTPDALAADLYGFTPNPGALPTAGFGGLIDLTAQSTVLAVLAGAAQFLQGMLAFGRTSGQQKEKRSDFENAMSLQMRFVFPVATVFIVRLLPAGIALYWIVTALFSAAQQAMMLRKTPQPAAAALTGAER